MIMLMRYSPTLSLVISLLFQNARSFQPLFPPLVGKTNFNPITSSPSFALSSTSPSSQGDEAREDESDSIKNKNDGSGSGISDDEIELSKRFNYKVHALMGSFDPILGEDNENQGGNILNAMVNFPAKYAFNVVAKTDGDEEIISKYVEDVKAILQNSIIPSEENTIEVEVIPRGSKYTKVKLEAIVESHKSRRVRKDSNEILSGKALSKASAVQR